MIDIHSIDSDEYYDPRFYKYASLDIITQNYPFIGEVIAQFNSIEDEINEGLIDSINNDCEEIGWMVISDLPFSAKLKLWKKIVSFLIYEIQENDELKKKLTAELKELSKAIEKLAGIRNKIAHADWDNAHENLFVKINSDVRNDKIRHNYIKIDEAQFNEIIGEFLITERRLIEFSKEIDQLL